MKNTNNKNGFFGLDASAKVKVVRKAVNLANKEQLDLVNKHGGVKAIRAHCKCG